MRNALSYEPGVLHMSDKVTDGAAGGMSYKDADVNAKVNMNYGALQCEAWYDMLLVACWLYVVKLAVFCMATGASLTRLLAAMEEGPHHWLSPKQQLLLELTLSCWLRVRSIV